MKITFDYNAQSSSVELIPAGKSYRLVVGEQAAAVEVLRLEDGKLELLLAGRRVTAWVSSDQSRRWVTINGRTFALGKAAGGPASRNQQAHAGEMIAPMPGQIRAVNVGEGEAVTKGQTLVVLEAMKMEIRVQAPRDGKVKKLFVKQGQTVEREQVLVEIEAG